mmetsp:Transcript_6128/g.13215  ORF Transcript_6128/g.13215 Transcript_6128/m.13215 type:complete len:1374 (-) Transcript_6128:274-4395(-)
MTRSPTIPTNLGPEDEGEISQIIPARSNRSHEVSKQPESGQIRNHRTITDRSRSPLPHRKDSEKALAKTSLTCRQKTRSNSQSSSPKSDVNFQKKKNIKDQFVDPNGNDADSRIKSTDENPVERKKDEKELITGSNTNFKLEKTFNNTSTKSKEMLKSEKDDVGGICSTTNLTRTQVPLEFVENKSETKSKVCIQELPKYNTKNESPNTIMDGSMAQNIAKVIKCNGMILRRVESTNTSVSHETRRETLISASVAEDITKTLSNPLKVATLLKKSTKVPVSNDPLPHKESMPKLIGLNRDDALFNSRPVNFETKNKLNVRNATSSPAGNTKVKTFGIETSLRSNEEVLSEEARKYQNPMKCQVNLRGLPVRCYSSPLSMYKVVADMLFIEKDDSSLRVMPEKTSFTEVVSSYKSGTFKNTMDNEKTLKNTISSNKPSLSVPSPNVERNANNSADVTRLSCTAPLLNSSASALFEMDIDESVNDSSDAVQLSLLNAALPNSTNNNDTFMSSQTESISPKIKNRNKVMEHNSILLEDCVNNGSTSFCKSPNIRIEQSDKNNFFTRKRKSSKFERERSCSYKRSKVTVQKYQDISDVPIEAIKWALLEAATIRARYASTRRCVADRNGWTNGNKHTEVPKRVVGGPEKQFAIYWEELCHFMLGRRTRIEMEEVLDEFLGVREESKEEEFVDSQKNYAYMYGSRRMRALHNELIYALMRQAMKPTINEFKYASYIPTAWRPVIKRVSVSQSNQTEHPTTVISHSKSIANSNRKHAKKHISPQKSQSNIHFSTPIPDPSRTKIKFSESLDNNNPSVDSDWKNLEDSFGRDSSVWIPCGNNFSEVLPKLSQDEEVLKLDCFSKFHTKGDQMISLPDEKLSGGLLVDPKVRKTCKAQGLGVTEHAIWLLVIAVRDHAISILKRAVENTKSIKSGTIPTAQTFSGGMGSISSFYRSGNAATRLPKPPNAKTNENKYYINAFNIAHVTSLYPLESGGSLNGSFSRLQWERCIFGSSQRIISLPPVGGTKLKYIVDDGYRSLSTKRRRVESKERIYKVSKNISTGSTSFKTVNSSSDSRRIVDPNFKSPGRSESSAKQHASRMLSKETSRQHPNQRSRSLRQQPASPGNSRVSAGKDLAAMRTRSDLSAGDDQQGRETSNLPMHQIQPNDYMNKNSGRRSADPTQIQQPLSSMQSSSGSGRRIGQKELILIRKNEEQRRHCDQDGHHSKQGLESNSDRRSSLNTQYMQRQSQHHHQQPPQQNHHQQQNSSLNASMLGQASQINPSYTRMPWPGMMNQAMNPMMMPQGVPQHNMNNPGGNGIPIMNQSGLNHMMMSNTRLGPVPGQIAAAQSIMMYNPARPNDPNQNMQNPSNSPGRPPMVRRG